MLKRVLSALLALGLVFALCFVERATVEAAQYGVINVNKTYLRQSPKSTAKAIVTLKKNSKVELLTTGGTWYKAKVSGKTGYVAAKYVTKQAVAKKGVTTTAVNMRKSQSTNSKIIVTLRKNTSVSIISYASGWYKVSYGARIGYIRSTYIKVASVPLASDNTAPSSIVPSSAAVGKIVTTSTAKYTPAMLKKELGQLAYRYSDRMLYFEFGQSTWGTPLYCAVVGNPAAPRKILLNGNTHAREYMTVQLMMMQIEQLCIDYNTKTYNGRLYKDILNDTAIYFVPMLNPDGTAISQSGMTGVPSDWKNYIKSVPFSSDCSSLTRWKGNGSAIDLNRNYPVGWYKNTKTAGSWSGNRPLEASEAIALTELCKAYNFQFAMNYHSTGSILYWRDIYVPDSESRPFMTIVQSQTKYGLMTDNKSTGGFKGWFCYTFKKPCFTIEVGTTSCPLPISQLPDIWNRNKLIPISLANQVAGQNIVSLPPSAEMQPEPETSSTQADSIITDYDN